MTAIIIISVIIIGVVLYMMGGNVYDKSRGDLELKYSSLVSLLLSTHDRIRLLKKDSNIVVLGVVSMGGKTLFTIKERPKDGGGDEVSIVYTIKDNPTCKDFDLRFVYSEHKCLADPEFVLSSINQKIKEYLIMQHQM
jgi:hypothetical protein